MKPLLILLTALAISAPAAAEAPSTGGARQGSRVEANRTGTLQPADRRFLEEAVRGNLAEITLGRLAQQRASNSQVREFAERMMNDHRRANDQVLQLADRRGLMLSNDMTTEQKAIRDRLRRLNGAAFDRAYTQAMVREHRKAVDLFSREARSGSDPEVMALAARMLPQLRTHLEHAEQLAGVKSRAARKR